MVDASSDHGHSGGIDGAASSLDRTVRAAAALAEHAIRQGDRVALRVVSGDGAQVGFGAGRLHLRRILGTLSVVRPSQLGEGYAARLRLRATDGTMVVLLSPMLEEHIGTAAITLLQRRLPTMVVDTLPPDAGPAFTGGTDPAAHRPGVADAPAGARRAAWPASPPGAVRWWPGGAPARSTTCSGAWPATPSSRP